MMTDSKAAKQTMSQQKINQLAPQAKDEFTPQNASSTVSEYALDPDSESALSTSDSEK